MLDDAKTRRDMPNDQQNDGCGASRLRFPWADTDGLTTGLQDPRLWAAVFEFPRPRAFVKAAAKDVLHARGVAINNGEQVGALTVNLMSSRKGRAALFREFKKLSATPEAFVAERLHEELVRRKIAVPKTLYRWQGRKFFLDPDALEESPAVFDGWEPEKVLLAAAPFAILQRHETPRIVSLLRRDPHIATLIDSEGEVFQEAREGQPPNADSAPIAQRSPPAAPGNDPLEESPREELPAAVVALAPSEVTTVAPSVVAISDTYTPSSETPLALSADLPLVSRTSTSPQREPRPTTRDERLVLLAAALRNVTEAMQAVQLAFAAGDIDRGLAAGEKARSARGTVRLEYEKLRKREDVVVKDWEAAIPTSAFADLVASDSWLNELQSSLEAQEEHRQNLVRRQRESLGAEFVRVGLSPPDDLEAARTLEQVQAIRGREQATIALETAWKTMLEERDTGALSDLDANRRGLLVTRLLDLPEYADLALLLFVSDAHIKRVAPLERVVPLIREQVQKYAALPTGLWAALAERARDGLVLLFDAHGLSALVPDADEELMNSHELRDVLLRVPVPVGHVLYVWTLEARLVSLAPERQIQLLIEVASQSSDPLPVGSLLDALNAAGRSPEAVVVASAAWRSGRLSELGFGAAREAFLRVMIHACQHTNRHALLKNLLMSPEDLIRYEEGLITLVYVATHVEPALVDTMVWRGSTTYEVAAAKYPALVNEWLLTIRAGFVPRDVIKAKESELLRAQAAYSEWLHELGRKSTYTGWSYAQEYQRHIVDWLKHVFAALDRTGAVGDQPDEDDLLEDFRERHKLPKVEGQARKNMHVYINAQRDRLAGFARILRDHDLKGSLARTLENPHRTLRSRLEFEASSAPGVLRDLYNIALREVTA